MDQSLFERLDSENNTVTLTSQYRMNQRIMSLANKVTYKDQLTIGIDEIGNATLNIPNKSVRINFLRVLIYVNLPTLNKNAFTISLTGT